MACEDQQVEERGMSMFPVICPACGEMGPDGEVWQCGCGLYTHYPEDLKVTARWRKTLDMMHYHITSYGGQSQKSKRYGGKKVKADYDWRYRIE
jgi:hypothetical protein